MPVAVSCASHRRNLRPGDRQRAFYCYMIKGGEPGSHPHKFRHRWSHYDKWHEWRENQADQLHAARKVRSNVCRRDSLTWRLENKPLRPALRSVLHTMLRQHRDDPAYDTTDAFIDILTTLKPDCDAGREARWIGSRFGLPVDGCRQEIAARLQEMPGKPSRCSQEAQVGAGHAVREVMEARTSHAARKEGDEL